MKKMVAITIIFFLFSITIYADDDFFIKERNLLERGYTNGRIWRIIRILLTTKRSIYA
jgi:hypothetical protein